MDNINRRHLTKNHEVKNNNIKCSGNEKVSDSGQRYCDVCGKVTNTTIITKEENYIVGSEKLQVFINTDVRVCLLCGHNVSDFELDKRTLLRVFDVYRERFKLLKPSDITTLRQSFRLSVEEFAAMLEMDKLRLYRIEQGNSLQTNEEDSKIKYVSEHDFFRVKLFNPEWLLKIHKSEIGENIIEEVASELRAHINSMTTKELIKFLAIQYKNTKDGINE